VKKYTVCCDFDGVIHSYVSGWKGATVIPDPPNPGALEWIIQVLEHPKLMLTISSSRLREPGSHSAMMLWLIEHFKALFSGTDPTTAGQRAADVVAKIGFDDRKPPAVLYIDDRGFHFTGTFPSPEWILGFQPWTKQGPRPTLPPRPSQERLREIAGVLYDTQQGEYSETGLDPIVAELLAEIEHLRGEPIR